MGSPEFALPSLKQVAEKYPVVGVVTQPDRPAGRGRTLTPPPVKLLAQQLGLPVIQPQRLKEPQAMEQLRQWEPELIVVAAFGQILRLEVLELPRFGCVNVHASLLPRWRGAAPIQAAILNGDAQTGITIMRMDAGVDTGAILSQRAVPISVEDTAATLSNRLAQMGADLLIETLPRYLKSEMSLRPQDNRYATYAPMLKKEDGLLDLTQGASDLARKVRAFDPWPGAFITWQGQPLKIHRAHVEDSSTDIPPGSYTAFQGKPALGTSQGLLVLDEVQPAGKKPMSGEVFLRGARGWE